jgi:hypothetical protein
MRVRVLYFLKLFGADSEAQKAGFHEMCEIVFGLCRIYIHYNSLIITVVSVLQNENRKLQQQLNMYSRKID